MQKILEKLICYFHRCATYQRDISKNTNDWNLPHIYEMEDIFTYSIDDSHYDT